jgi:hypothetical protein
LGADSQEIKNLVTILLTPEEISCLHRQSAASKSDGGFQGLLVALQQRIRPSGELTLTIRDLERIQRCAFKYKNGGWQRRLKAIFERTLGPTLGSQYLPKAA